MPLLMLDQSPSLSKLLLDSKITNLESTPVILVKIPQTRLIMQFWLLAMELIMELIIGSLKTLGALHGEIKDFSKSKEELTCVELLSVTLSQC